MACWEDPHCRSTVVAGTLWGRPAATQPLRVTLVPCSPDWVTQPPITSSTVSGSTPVRPTSVVSAKPRRSTGCQCDRAPPRLPRVVRTTSTMTASRSLLLTVVPLPPALLRIARCRRYRDDRHRTPSTGARPARSPADPADAVAPPGPALVVPSP